MRLATSKLDTAQLIADLEQNGLTDALVMSELLCEFEQARCMLVMVELARAGHAKPVLIGGKLRFELTEQAGASAVVTRPPCPINHDDARRDASLWLSLTYAGVQLVEADEDGPEQALEMRTCPHCLSTLAKEVTP